MEGVEKTTYYSPTVKYTERIGYILNNAQNIFKFSRDLIEYPAGNNDTPETTRYTLKLNHHLRRLLNVDFYYDLQPEWLDFQSTKKVSISLPGRDSNSQCSPEDTIVGSVNFDWVYTDIVVDPPGNPTNDKYKLLRFVDGSVLYPEQFIPLSRSRFSTIDIKIKGLIGSNDRAILVLHFRKGT